MNLKFSRGVKVAPRFYFGVTEDKFCGRGGACPGDEKRAAATVGSSGEPPHSKMLRSRVFAELA
jgi:hypothetical protein